MIEALFSVAGITPKEYLKDQGLLKKMVKDKGYIKNIARQIINARLTVFAQSGRCTALAIAVAKLSHDADRKIFGFEHFDLGGHSLARCNNTENLIDSASPTGPVIVQGHLRKTIKDDPQMRRWKCTEGSSKYIDR
ncbi:hypothetical protein DL95DRAFT_465275 [Leptodontidium sp. 2 PMI_412]|nr:hypothetical protein DL95DRAFT_465275 [Leptodontidium sp. 2 PMI_412]